MSDRKEIKAIFFDMDNTLLATREAAKDAYKDAFRALSKDLDVDYDLLYEKWKAFIADIVGSNDPKERRFSFSLQKTLEEAGIQDIDVEPYEKIMEKSYLSSVKVNPGVKEFFEKNELKKIVFTESERVYAVPKLEKFELLDKVDLLVTCTETGVMKPSIKYLELGWEEFGLKPDECVYVGDNWAKDCQLGQERGGIGVVFGAEDERADYQIKDMRELKRIIDIHGHGPQFRQQR